MTTYRNFDTLAPTTSTYAICEGGAGWMRGQWIAEMHVGGWAAVVAARAANRPLPPIDGAKAKAYWAAARDGDVVLSNFVEDRFDLYHGSQLAVALAPAKARGLVVAHYGFPSFDTSIDYAAFWQKVGYMIDIITPAYYANDDADWTADEWTRMAYQIRRAKEFAGTSKQLGFVISPQTHGGANVRPEKLKQQVAYLKASGVQHLFVWSGKNNDAANDAAVATASATSQAEGAES